MAEEKKPGAALVSWKDRMVAVTKVTQEAEKPQGGFISFKGGRMTYGDEILPGDKIRAVIVDYRFDNELYLEKYDPKKTVSPSCFAIVKPGELIAPHLDSEFPQGTDTRNETAGLFAPGAQCEDCWANEWKSDLQGGKGKACKTSRRIHIIAADDARTPESIEKASVISMIPPATSVENFQLCMNQISKVLDTAMFGAVVEISVKPHDKFLYQVHFKIVEQITDEALLEALTFKYEKTSEREITYVKNSEREEGGPDPRTQSSKY